MHTNCIDGMKTLPDNCIPLTITSPPYGNMRTYGDEVGGYDWNVFTAIAEQLARITMVGGVICWVLRNKIHKGSENCQAEREKLHFVDELGLRPFQTIIGAPLGCPITNDRHGRYVANCDYIYVFSKERPRYAHVIRDKRNRRAGAIKSQRLTREPDGTEKVACGGNHVIPEFGLRTNVWQYPVGGCHTATDGALSRDHPARMPESVAEDLIISYSTPNDVVFDPMAGAGTTLKMAMLNNRRFLGMELNAGYVKTIRKRLAHAETKCRPKKVAAFMNRFRS